MKLCFYTFAYPGKHDTSHYAFVKQLIDAIAAKGNECHVVAPYNVLHYKKIVARNEKYNTGNGVVAVYRPYYLSFSQRKGLQWLTKLTRKYALWKAETKLPSDLDAVYGHFWRLCYEGYPFAKKQNLPLFVASGESDIKKNFGQFPSDIKIFSNYVKGVICVSSKNQEESVGLGLTTPEKCGVFPNAINSDIFKKRDKIKCRQKLCLPQDEFIVVFVGWFTERKGPLRVSEAIRQVGGVKSIFIGKGDQEPDCEGILFKGALPHEDVPYFLGAADCFVLPTRAEGCCNAVVEAMACGLPVISSNLSFNWDVLDDTNSIMVDPNNTMEIAMAIRTLRDDKVKRNNLAEGALERAANLTIEKRAEAIIDFIKAMI